MSLARSLLTLWRSGLLAPLVALGCAGGPATGQGQTQEVPRVLHVSTHGNDAWSGRLAEPDAARTDGPLASLEGARDAVRKLKAQGDLPEGGVTVLVQGGTYRQAASFELGAEDSGGAGAPVVYRAAPGVEVRLTGGHTVPREAFVVASEPGVMARLRPEARGRVYAADLSALGVPLPAARDLGGQVGQRVDIAPSAYLYRADRRAEESPPESWIGLMQYAGLPYDKPVSATTPAVKPVLCALLWEEVRPLRELVLTWPAESHAPAPDQLRVTCFDATDDTAHTWWNPRSLRELAAPRVSADGRTYTYAVPVDTWGVFIARRDGKPARGWPVPALQALVADTWKRMDLELEWGYDPARAALAYDGSLAAYDGVIAGLAPLRGDEGTRVTGPLSWTSTGAGAGRRGLRCSLLYQGVSTWRRTWPYAAQPEDVARTLVTVRTASGSFTFLAADLEHGPILAPEYGFFVRAPRVRRGFEAAAATVPQRQLLGTRMGEIPGVPLVRGWANDTIPWFGANPSAEAGSAGSLTIPARCVAMHPLPDRDVAAGWRSPMAGKVRVTGRVAMADASGGNGVDWRVVDEAGGQSRVLAEGHLDTGGAAALPALEASVAPGDMVSLVIGPRAANHVCDTTVVELAISEEGGEGREWGLTGDVVDDVQAGNPHADRLGNTEVWWFYSPPPVAAADEPPFSRASRAGSAAEFERELADRGLTTIRQRTRAHAEQTWDGAMEAMRPGESFPPTPSPGLFPAMRVEVPDERLSAQWNLAAWHILRRSLQDDQGRWRFNDYPFGILASETYLILRALDLQGMHKEAADGLDQWLSLPLHHQVTPGANGQHPWSRPDRPLGHFSDGEGCLTLAEGIEGAGGHMDGVHCMGPGAIMLALAEHYRLSGDEEWLRKAAPRIRANAEWILRQRKLLRTLIPGGEKLWGAGLQPAHVVTPDSMCMYQQFYESEAYYWLGVKAAAELLARVDPAAARRLRAEAEAYRHDLLAAVERSIALTPVVQVRDGTYHSFIPFAPYVRGFASGAWGWRRCQGHVGALYWDTVQSADPLIDPARLLAVDDPRTQGHLDVLEDRLLLEGPKVPVWTPDLVADRDWFGHASWQYQCGLERHANIHLAGDDAPCFIRSWLNQYAVDIMPGEYTFREHTVAGPPDKLFEESAFLERFRMLLVMEEGDALWLARATPRAWLEQGKRIAVRDAPTRFGPVSYELESDVAQGTIRASLTMPARQAPGEVLLRLRHPEARPLREVLVNGQPWADFDAARECVRLRGLTGTVSVVAAY